MVAPSILRLSWWWGVQVWDIVQPRPVAWQQSTYVIELVVVVCRFGGSRVGKTLAFSRPSRTDTWCGCLSVWSCSGWAYFPACVLSPYMYLAVYYLCRLQIPRSSPCPSPATNMYARFFPSTPALRNLRNGGDERWGLWFAGYGTRAFIKNIIRRAETINKNLEIFLVYNICEYYCEPSQRTGNRLVYTILKAPVSTVVMRHFFTNNPSQLFQINPLHVYRCQTTPDMG
jgi:hypothetical protein